VVVQQELRQKVLMVEIPRLALLRLLVAVVVVETMMLPQR
jgi:hypothetical protein